MIPLLITLYCINKHILYTASYGIKNVINSGSAVFYEADRIYGDPNPDRSLAIQSKIEYCTGSIQHGIIAQLGEVTDTFTSHFMSTWQMIGATTS